MTIFYPDGTVNIYFWSCDIDNSKNLLLEESRKRKMPKLLNSNNLSPDLDIALTIIVEPLFK